MIRFLALLLLLVACVSSNIFGQHIKDWNEKKDKMTEWDSKPGIAFALAIGAFLLAFLAICGI